MRDGRLRGSLTPTCYGVSLAPYPLAGNATVPLPYVDQDLAAFLLMRGPHAWIGWGQWGMLWPTNPDGSGLPFPPQMTAEYGKALNASCAVVNATAFSRTYERATVTLDCASWTATIE